MFLLYQYAVDDILAVYINLYILVLNTCMFLYSLFHSQSWIWRKKASMSFCGFLRIFSPAHSAQTKFTACHTPLLTASTLDVTWISTRRTTLKVNNSNGQSTFEVEKTFYHKSSE